MEPVLTIQMDSDANVHLDSMDLIVLRWITVQPVLVKMEESASTIQMDSDVNVHLDLLDPHVQMWMIVQQRIHVGMEDPVWMDLDLIPVNVWTPTMDQDVC